MDETACDHNITAVLCLSYIKINLFSADITTDGRSNTCSFVPSPCDSLTCMFYFLVTPVTSQKQAKLS